MRINKILTSSSVVVMRTMDLFDRWSKVTDELWLSESLFWKKWYN